MTDTLVYIVNSAAWSAGGLIIGWLLGRSARDVHDIKEATVPDEAKPARRRNKVDGFNLVVVIIMGIAAIITGFAAHESDQATKRVDDVVTCNQQVLEKTVQALNERTTLSAESTRIRERRLRSQIRLVDALLDPEAQPSIQSVRARAYRDAVRAQIRVDAKTAKRRENHPYPSAEQIRSCG